MHVSSDASSCLDDKIYTIFLFPKSQNLFSQQKQHDFVLFSFFGPYFVKVGCCHWLHNTKKNVYTQSHRFVCACVCMCVRGSPVPLFYSGVGVYWLLNIWMCSKIKKRPRERWTSSSPKWTNSYTAVRYLFWRINALIYACFFEFVANKMGDFFSLYQPKNVHLIWANVDVFVCILFVFIFHPHSHPYSRPKTAK